MQLPARYVAEHVELGYAATIHRAQGATVDTAHVIARAGMSGQALYVAMTRGRQANHAYVPLDAPQSTEFPGDLGGLTGRQVLEAVLATDGSELSATATMRQRQDAATAPRRLSRIRETLDGAAQGGPSEPDVERAAQEVSSLIRLRAALQRPAPRRSAPRSASAYPPPNRQGPGPLSR